MEEKELFQETQASNLEPESLNLNPVEVVEEPKDALEGLILFTTATCPNCKMAKMLLDKAGIHYTVIDAEDNKAMTLKYKVNKAPTLIVPSDEGYDVFENASNIKGYIESIN